MWEASLPLRRSAVAHQTGTPVASRLVVASPLVVASGLAPRWAAKQPQSIGMRSIRHSSAAGSGAAAQPNAGQARSPQQARSPTKIRSL